MAADIAVTGASGFIGSALVPALEAAGHRVVRLVRAKAVPGAIVWDPVSGTIDAAGLEGVGAVVHLAGAGIGDRRWTQARKQLIRESRTRGTEMLARTLSRLGKPPAVFVCASAVGYYGNRGDEILTEVSTPGADFLADLCVRWEAAAGPAVEAGIRTVHVRTGVVLDPSGGVLKRLLPAFRLGLGGRIGSGRQFLSWITRADVIAAIQHVLSTERLHGAVNLTAPNPVTNAAFTQSLGRALHRPTVIPTPLWPLKLVYGAELVQHLLLFSQRALPAALEGSGFAFRHPEIDDALRELLARGAPAR